MRRSALFNSCGDQTLRREIRRWWVDNPQRWAAWLMLNPSNASAHRDDPTAMRVTHFTSAWGYDGWIGVNLYPLVSSNPEVMWRWQDWESSGPDWHVRDMLQLNLEDIERVGRSAAFRVVAFGAQPIEHDQLWLEACLEAYGQPADREGDDERLWCLGTTKAGQPLHPMARGKMRVPDGQKPILWRD